MNLFSFSRLIYDLTCFLFILNQLYFNATDPLSELWQRAWIIPAFWNVLSYALLVIICILWSPSHNPTGYFCCQFHLLISVPLLVVFIRLLIIVMP
jgi:hypothetical protein